MTASVLLTLDFDAESPWLQPGVDAAARDLTQLSWAPAGPMAAFDVARGAAGRAAR